MSNIIVKEIYKSYGNTSVIEDISIEIKSKEFITLVGPSGCGKSTLLRIIAGLEQINSGRIYIDQKDVTFVRPSDRNLAMVFQSYALYPHLTVKENMLTPLKLRDLSSFQRFPLIGKYFAKKKLEELDILVSETAEILRLKKLLNRKPGQLSGGQRQRAALGRAMVRKPIAFLMDEPLSNLDAALRVHMRSELSELHKKLGITFIYVTHDQAEALTMSNRMAVMMDGRILQLDEPNKIYSEPNCIKVAEFIGSPKINILPATTDKLGYLSIGNFKSNFKTKIKNTKIFIGFRSENIVLNKKTNQFNGRVKHIENLGSDYFLHLKVKSFSDKIIIRIPQSDFTNIKVDSPIDFSINLEKILFFDVDGVRFNASYHTFQKKIA